MPSDTGSVKLHLGTVYEVKTVDGITVIGAYAGTENGRHCFSPGLRLPSAWIPAAKLADVRRMI